MFEVFGGTHGVIMTFIIGLVVGIIAKFLMPGKDPGGFIVTAILGIVGSFLATWAGKALNLYQPGQTAGWIGSIVGAIIVLLIYRVIRRKSTSG